jgi:Na+-transporting NADH:ubiquinone oxidoreductase subunit NqrB
MKDFESAMDGLAAIALAVYLAMVLARGNLKPFLAQVTKETGFVEFLVALWILSLILKIPEVRPMAAPLVTMAAIILAMRIVAGADISAFNDFASGRAGLFQTIGRVFGNQA